MYIASFGEKRDRSDVFCRDACAKWLSARTAVSHPVVQRDVPTCRVIGLVLDEVPSKDEVEVASFIGIWVPKGVEAITFSLQLQLRRWLARRDEAIG
jgi:hypothetical protein